MLNRLKDILLNEYGGDDNDFIIGVLSAVHDSEENIRFMIEYIEDEHPPKDQVVLYSVKLHRGYDF